MGELTAVAATLLQDSKKRALTTFTAIPYDKIDWKPLDEGRSALELMAECVVANKMAADTLRVRGISSLDWYAEISALTGLEAEEVVSLFVSATDDLVTVIEQFPDDALDETLKFSSAGQPIPYRELIFLPTSHQDYHIGQLNYIQTLYGDKDMHT